MKLNTIIFGISADSSKSHANFSNKFDLPFPLLADTEKEVLKKYGVWGLKKMAGREYEGIFRTTFIIDPKGNIDKVFEGVKPAAHSV